MKDRFKFRVLEKCDRCGFKYHYYGMTNIGVIQDGWEECEKHCMSKRYPTETIEQCTGLKDKNGVLIFEGDIVNYELDDKPRIINHLNGTYYISDDVGNGDVLGAYIFRYSIEITGTIHDA